MPGQAHQRGKIPRRQAASPPGVQEQQALGTGQGRRAALRLDKPLPFPPRPQVGLPGLGGHRRFGSAANTVAVGRPRRQQLAACVLSLERRSTGRGRVLLLLARELGWTLAPLFIGKQLRWLRRRPDRHLGRCHVGPGAGRGRLACFFRRVFFL